MHVTQTVSEARYTYWHSIVDIATASGLSREEFCQKYKISLKTFIHYEGIFRRQKARGYVYHRNEGDDKVNPSDDNGASLEKKSRGDSAGTAGDSVNNGGCADDKAGDGEQAQAGTTERAADERSRYVEIPMIEGDADAADATEDVDAQDSAEAGEDASEETISIDQDGESQMETDDTERESIVLDMGGCRISIGNSVKESTLLAVLKAVSANA